MQPFRVWAEIDLTKLKKNLHEMKRLVSDDTKILAVIKADAYGHGAVAVGKAIESQVDYLGVGDSQEALELRESGIKTPILILGAIVTGEMALVVKADITVAVHSLEQILKLNEEAVKQGKQVKVHLLIDTGMTRFGVSHLEALTLLRAIKNCNNLSLEGIGSHFSSANEKNRVFSHSQLERFLSVIHQAKEFNINPPLIHIANSAGMVNYDSSQFSMVRPGLSLFGIDPGYQIADKPKLEPVLSLHSQVIFIRKALPEGTPISYSRRYYTASPTDIAVIPVGYNDGYRRWFSSPSPLGESTEVIIQGKRAPVAGTITMDYTMIDVGHIPEVNVGDKVTLIGSQKNCEIKVEELAEKSMSIPYEIFCGLSKRVVKLYKNDVTQPFQRFNQLSKNSKM